MPAFKRLLRSFESAMRARSAEIIQQTDSLRCGEATAVASVHRTLAKSRLSNPSTTTKSPTPNGVGLFVAIADKIDAVDFGIKIRKLEKMLCCNNFSHFDAWIFLIFIIGQNRCIHLNFCSGNELEDFKKDFDPSNIGILQYTPLAHAHKTIHRSQKC